MTGRLALAIAALLLLAGAWFGARATAPSAAAPPGIERTSGVAATPSSTPVRAPEQDSERSSGEAHAESPEPAAGEAASPASAAPRPRSAAMHPVLRNAKWRKYAAILVDADQVPLSETRVEWFVQGEVPRPTAADPDRIEVKTERKTVTTLSDGSFMAKVSVPLDALLPATLTIRAIDLEGAPSAVIALPYVDMRARCDLGPLEITKRADGVRLRLLALSGAASLDLEGVAQSVVLDSLDGRHRLTQVPLASDPGPLHFPGQMYEGWVTLSAWRAGQAEGRPLYLSSTTPGAEAHPVNGQPAVRVSRGQAADLVLGWGGRIEGTLGGGLAPPEPGNSVSVEAFPTLPHTASESVELALLHLRTNGSTQPGAFRLNQSIDVRAGEVAEDGTFLIDDLPAGRWTVLVRQGDRKLAEVPGVEVALERSTRDPRLDLREPLR